MKAMPVMGAADILDWQRKGSSDGGECIVVLPGMSRIFSLEKLLSSFFVKRHSRHAVAADETRANTAPPPTLSRSGCGQTAALR
jgi:hypothetical protein